MEIFSKKSIKWLCIAGTLPALFHYIYPIANGIYFSPLMYVLGILFSIAITLGVSFSVTIILVKLERKYTWEQHPVKRIVIEFLSTNAVVTVFMVVVGYAYCEFGGTYDIMHKTRNEVILGYVITGFFMNFLITGISESHYFFNRWKESMVKAEKLEREHIQSQYEMLKQQVNPHFLFNSLNVLSSLIHSDIAKAEQFIDDFAKVYRYILDKSNQSLATLQDELEVVHSYLSLQKIRFNEGLDISILITPELQGAFLPALSLQLVVENAIKHNVVSHESPLRICIETHFSEIVISNNLQLRSDEVCSTGKGQANIRERYRLMGDKMPVFCVDDLLYVVRLPLCEQAECRHIS